MLKAIARRIDPDFLKLAQNRLLRNSVQIDLEHNPFRVIECSLQRRVQWIGGCG